MIRSILFCNLLLCVALCGQSAAPALSQDKAMPSAKEAAGKPALTVARSATSQVGFLRRADLHYGLVWGVDSLSVKSVESGEIIRLAYRVSDADKAQSLNDKKSEPSLIDAQTGVKLVIPSMEKVGQLRQSSTAEAGKAYWLAFSNKGRAGEAR